jgi:3',5'-cyclic AMP phosphodiesterase CpdA
MSDPWSILSISDIHFASNSKLDDAKSLEWPTLSEDIFPNFHNILEGFPKNSLDLVAVVGDITTRGDEKGFQRFTGETLPKLRELVVSEKAICIVPGNHDVKWGIDPESTNSFNKKFEEFKRTVDSNHTCCLFPDGKLTKDIDQKLKFVPSGDGPVHVDTKRKIIALCINSSIRCGEFNKPMRDDFAARLKDDFAKVNAADMDVENLMSSDSWKELHNKYFIRDVAHITQAQRLHLRKELDRKQTTIGKEWSSYLRVAVLHHHLVHFPGQIAEHKDYEFLIDSADMLSLLIKFDFDLVLTGHKHQPYVVKHLENGKELLLVGGPTVGGHAASNSFRGVRWIRVEDSGDTRTFKIRDIPHSAGWEPHGDVHESSKEICETLAGLSPTLLVDRRARVSGFKYREMASITEITPDGDAKRVIECKGFKANNSKSDRARSHQIHLPSTSGYITKLEASGKDMTIEIQDDIPLDRLARTWDTALKFSQPIGVGKPADYDYQWHAINCFALDKRQFGYMYKSRTPLKNVEFTHIATADPVEELTVIVNFPSDFPLKASPPRLRVARVNSMETNSRKWEIDGEAEQQLEDARAFRYYSHLNLAALRVKNPSADLSYGIQWEVPEPTTIPGDAAEQVAIQGILERAATPLRVDQQDQLVEALARVILATRTVFTPRWRGPMEASIWLFDGVGTLRTISDVMDDGKGKKGPLKNEHVLPYGSGIAGRAFKANVPRLYVPPRRSVDSEPDYYIPFPGTPTHKVLLCLPVHTPVTEKLMTANPKIYRSKIPYGVLSLGSQLAECPLAELRLPEIAQKLFTFQHRMNRLIYRAIKSAILAP